MACGSISWEIGIPKESRRTSKRTSRLSCLFGRLKRRWLRQAALSRLRWFEQLDRVAVRVFNLDLPSAGTGFHLVSKAQPRALEGVDASRKVRHFEHDAVPSTRLLRLTIRQRSRSGRSGAAEKDHDVAEGDTREGRQLLMVQLE